MLSFYACTLLQLTTINTYLLIYLLVMPTQHGKHYDKVRYW